MKKYILAAASLATFATPALAHHPLGGLPMETFTHGILSGVGHPLLGFDHLFFVIAVGVAALYTGFARLAPAAYIVAMVVGCLMMSFGSGLPIKEVVIGLSLLVVGGVVLSGRALGIVSALVLFAGFGLFHGSAFGDSIATQEAAVGTTVLVGYLLGLGVIQYGIALGAGYVVKHMMKASEATAMNARLTGALIAGIGVYLTLENLEGFILGA
ncbi:MAG: HupE/UreJ family protein [Hyphomicrobiales bacterium]